MNVLLLLPLHMGNELRGRSSTVLNLFDDLLPSPRGISRERLDGQASFVWGRTAFERGGTEGLEFGLSTSPIEVSEQLLSPLCI